MLRVHVDWREVSAALKDAKAAGKDLRPVWRVIRKPLLEDQRNHAKAQAGPDGSWASHSRSYTLRRRARPRVRVGPQLQRRRRRRRKVAPRRLRMLGRLPLALRVLSTRNSVSAISRVAWSGVHQTGGTVGRGRRVPKREFLWVGRGVLLYTVILLDKHVVEAFDRD